MRGRLVLQAGDGDVLTDARHLHGQSDVECLSHIQGDRLVLHFRESLELGDQVAAEDGAAEADEGAAPDVPTDSEAKGDEPAQEPAEQPADAQGDDPDVEAEPGDDQAS